MYACWAILENFLNIKKVHIIKRCVTPYFQHIFDCAKNILGSCALSGKMLLVRIIENIDKIDAYFRSG